MNDLPMTPPAARQPGAGAGVDVDALEAWASHFQGDYHLMDEMSEHIRDVCAYIRTVPALLAAAEVEAYKRGWLAHRAEVANFAEQILTDQRLAEYIRSSDEPCPYWGAR